MAAGSIKMFGKLLCLHARYQQARALLAPAHPGQQAEGRRGCDASPHRLSNVPRCGVMGTLSGRNCATTALRACATGSTAGTLVRL